jgi:glycosyltransferase involved in cell wall biosynthesis
MRVAIIHYWLVGMRGGERVLEELLTCFPQADIFTHVYAPETVSSAIRARTVHETFVGRLPGARRHYKKYLGFMPRALEELDLRDYDLVISSESGPAKGVLAPPSAKHICYCHTPMRYLYDHYPQYRDNLNFLERLYFSHLAHRLRQWDAISAMRVDAFVANSTFVASRIRRVYNRDADVVHPPVALDDYQPGSGARGDYYLAVSELVHYKRTDLTIEAFRGLDRELLVVGDGEERSALAKLAPPNVTLLGRVSTERLAELYQGARALIFPAEEDFGIVPVEAMACGCPVLAFGEGGARDSVADGVTGLLFARQSVESLRGCISKFESMTFDGDRVASHARGFSGERFRREFQDIVARVTSG